MRIRGSRCPGEYAAGWIKRGPTGVIGTNKPDAAETVAEMMEDLARRRPSRPDSRRPPPPSRCCATASHGALSYPDWQRLDALEIERGRALGRPRLKFTRVEDMLAALGR